MGWLNICVVLVVAAVALLELLPLGIMEDCMTRSWLPILAAWSCCCSTSLAALPVDRLQSVGESLKELSSRYDYVIIDLGAGIEQNVQYLASLASRCVVVINDEPTSLTDAYAFIKICETRPGMPKVNVVVNAAASQKEGEKTYEALNRACTNFLNVSPPCLGVIRRDNKIKEAIRSQTSLISKSPQTTAASDAAAISIKLMTNE